MLEQIFHEQVAPVMAKAIIGSRIDELERELADARRNMTIYAYEAREAIAAHERVCKELAAVKAERDRLRTAAKDALEIAENCRDYDDPMYDIEETLKEALAGE